MSLRKRLGLDGPVAYTFLARIVNIVGSTGTVLLIVRFLSPVEQGYYYTLLSLVALQAVFELGFSFVIQQLAAHECVHLKFRPDGCVAGDSVAHARLASALQLSLRWYTVAAAAMGLLLAPLGMIFLSTTAQEGHRLRGSGRGSQRYSHRRWAFGVCPSTLSLKDAGTCARWRHSACVRQLWARCLPGRPCCCITAFIHPRWS